MKSLLFAFVLAIGAPPPETPLLGFGSSVALDGERILVGRSGVAAGFPTPPNSPGSVHVFARQDGEWKEVSAFAGNDTRVVFGGRVMVHAKVRIDESQTPIAVDYLSLKDQKISLGILAFDGEILRVCMAPAGAPRPAEFTSTKANGWLVSDWKRR